MVAVLLKKRERVGWAWLVFADRTARGEFHLSRDVELSAGL